MVNETMLGNTISADDVKVKGSHTDGRWVLVPTQCSYQRELTGNLRQGKVL